MKYKNIELMAGNDSEAELLCSVEFENPEGNEEVVEMIEDKLNNLFNNFNSTTSVYFEAVTETLIQVRSDDLTFDQDGVSLLKRIYDVLINAKLNANIFVSVHVDGDTWFKREDGSEYNEDEISFEEFTSNIEY